MRGRIGAAQWARIFEARPAGRLARRSRVVRLNEAERPLLGAVQARCPQMLAGMPRSHIGRSPSGVILNLRCGVRPRSAPTNSRRLLTGKNAALPDDGAARKSTFALGATALARPLCVRRRGRKFWEATRARRGMPGSQRAASLSSDVACRARRPGVRRQFLLIRRNYVQFACAVIGFGRARRSLAGRARRARTSNCRVALARELARRAGAMSAPACWRRNSSVALAREQPQCACGMTASARGRHKCPDVPASSLPRRPGAMTAPALAQSLSRKFRGGTRATRRRDLPSHLLSEIRPWTPGARRLGCVVAIRVYAAFRGPAWEVPAQERLIFDGPPTVSRRSSDGHSTVCGGNG